MHHAGDGALVEAGASPQRIRLQVEGRSLDVLVQVNTSGEQSKFGRVMSACVS